MLSGAELGQEFWAEVVDTACYLVNRSPSSALEDKKPSLSHLGVFGCDAYVHVPMEKQTKLDSKSEKCIFFGEVKDVVKHEFEPKEPVKIEFELKEEEIDSVAEEESEDEEPQNPAMRRSVRERTEPERYSPSTCCSNFALSVTDDDPRTVKEAVELPAGRKPIGSKWGFKRKTNAEGKVEKYKARLVAKGYSQVP
eukprot:PITA_21782